MKIRSAFTMATAFLVALTLATPVQAKKLKSYDGVNYFEGHKETYYNLSMNRIYSKADKNFGSHHKKWIRDDGVKMYGPYIVVAACFDIHPYGSNVETSLGTGIVLDTGAFAISNPEQIDVAVSWGN